jgi:hypothetical protein
MTDQAPPQMPPGVHATPGPVPFVTQTLVDGHGNKLILLRLEHTAGSTIVGLDAEFCKQMGKALIEAGSGLKIVGT